jgi:hypothetical protein
MIRLGREGQALLNLEVKLMKSRQISQGGDSKIVRYGENFGPRDASGTGAHHLDE